MSDATSTGSEPHSLIIHHKLEVIKFVLQSVFTFMETIFPRIYLKSRRNSKSVNSPLPVDVRSKTMLLELPFTGTLI